MPSLAESLFSIAGLVVLPGWALLIFLPWWRWSTGLVPGVIIPVVIGLFYGGLMATNLFGAEGALARSPTSIDCSKTRICCWPDGCTTWRSIYSSGPGRFVIRGGWGSITYSSYRVCYSPSCWVRLGWRSILASAQR